MFSNLDSSCRREGICCPWENADELARLQDRVPPFPSATGISTIESEMGNLLQTYFQNFSSQSPASASLAQVHEATLVSGEEVVVKVIRPGIAQSLEKICHSSSRWQSYSNVFLRMLGDCS
ncbi:MAG: hypothetical protein Ct9H300mP8_11400 [Gammaproteobacteria bacterium]|nr:MAG: hypothetical protein Ct9H300mP8_11400 [Gammaproteobacteria bacterium]